MLLATGKVKMEERREIKLLVPPPYFLKEGSYVNIPYQNRINRTFDPWRRV